MKTFTAGTTYFCRSVCDYDCVWRFKVVKRTKSTISIQEVDHAGQPFDGKIKTCRVYNYCGSGTCEAVRPLGSYSMAPILTAEKICTNSIN